MKNHILRKYIQESLKEVFWRDDPSRSAANLSKDPNLLTGKKMLKAQSGKDLSSIVGIFDDLEDYIKAANVDDLKRITMDVPRENVKKTLGDFRERLTIFARMIGQEEKNKLSHYEKNIDDLSKRFRNSSSNYGNKELEDSFKASQNTSYKLQDLIDSGFDALMK